MSDLLEEAKRARLNAHSPYSGVKVGAALRAGSGKVYSGCNVENASYGATVCAERVAIQKAISEGEKEITELVVVTDATPAWPPCSLCRQVLTEFAHPNLPVLTRNLKNEGESFTLAELVPHAFTPAHLKKK